MGLAIGEKKGDYMKKKIRNKKTLSFGPQGAFRVIQDFLPSPEELAEKERKERITINLSKQTLNIFKKYAKEYDISYQVMIRNALDKIALNFEYR